MLITEPYRQQIEQLHRENARWGTTGKDFAPVVKRLIGDFDPLNILDYGCGKQTLALALPQYRIRGYDPALPGMNTPPEPHDLVICTDVLEHIEPDCLEDVLDDLQRVTRKTLFVQVCTVDAKQILPDGRNAHLIVKPARWWVGLLWDRFNLFSYGMTTAGFSAVLLALKPKGNGTK